MTPASNWHELKSLLDDLIEIDLADRRMYLEKHGADAETIKEIESLLELEHVSDEIFEPGAVSLAKDLFDVEADSSTNLAGAKIGVFTVVSELGIGGMGAVYLAERNDGKFEQRVAIKLLRREFNVERIREIFNREIEILSKLSHPNIARLIDTGVTDDAIPYFVMEYVDGIPIDRYCFDNDLPLIQRLKLFNKTCDAVAFAHRNLIVHRDLKPSNILITKSREPILLDFGISKILEAEAVGEQQNPTLFNALTPDYASPEQISGGQVTTVSDVYGLGVVLYRILTGAHPFRRPKQSDSDLLKAITDEEPTMPSAVVSDAASKHPGSSRSDLKGDLDNIVLRSIEKDPDRRYASVEKLSADIWKFIDGRPIEARPATRAYRLSKFYSRNKLAVAATAGIFVALIAGLSVALWQTGVARASAAQAATESENARSEQKRSEKISKFMMKFLSYANPHWHAEGQRFEGEARVIDALNDMVGKIDTEFAEQPDVLAELHHQFSDVYTARARKSGGPELSIKARHHAVRALDLRRSFYGDWHELVAKDMAFVFWTSLSKPDEASVKMLSDAITMMRATNPNNRNLPYMLEDYVNAIADDDDLAKAELYLRAAPQPKMNDRNQTADLLFDEMLMLVRTHFPEDSDPVNFQKCRGIVIKLKANKRAEADELYTACERHREQRLAQEKPIDSNQLEWLSEYRRRTANK